MNIKSIKNRAEELLTMCKPQMIRICVIMGLVQLVPSLFQGNNIIASLVSFIALIAFVTFSHGYVVSSLKVVRNNSQALSDEDAFVGFKRFKELFPTYILTGLITFGFMFVMIIVMTFLIVGSAGSAPAIDAGMMNNPGAFMLNFFVTSPSFIFLFLLMFILIFVGIFVIDAYLFAVPYLLEEYHMTGKTAIKESFSIMKSHVWDWVKLELSFIGWMILVSIVQSVLAQLLSFLPVGMMISLIVSAILSAYLYYPKYIISKAILFEEIAYYRYNQFQGEMNYE